MLNGRRTLLSLLATFATLSIFQFRLSLRSPRWAILWPGEMNTLSRCRADIPIPVGGLSDPGWDAEDQCGTPSREVICYVEFGNS